MNKSMSRILIAVLFSAGQAQAAGKVAMPNLGMNGAPVVPVVGLPGLQGVPQLHNSAVPAVVLPDVNVLPMQAIEAARTPSLKLIEASLPQQDLSNVPANDARGAGVQMSDAVTGENTAKGEGDVNVPITVDLSAMPSELQQRVNKAKAVTDKIRDEVGKVIVGQKEMVNAIIMAMVARQHVLLEGFPGVAKTETAKAFSASVSADFKRVQGAPDREPAEITGSKILQTNPATGERTFVTKKGPVFTNILLVDEINRMTPKTQSSILEPMAEGQVTIEDETFPLGHFTVIATQNPVEQDGTYPLPEAQQDRFMFKVLVPQPAAEDIDLIGERNESRDKRPTASKVTDLNELDEVRKTAEDVHMDEDIKTYIRQLVMAPSDKSTPAAQLISKDVTYTVYTRAAIYMRKAARIHAMMQGRDHVLPSDVQAVYPLIMRHRIVLGFSAGITPDALIQKILETVPVPVKK